MPFQYPGPNNAYIPELNGMVAALIRDPNKFKLNEYVSFRPSDREIGVYTKIDNSEAARVVTIDSYTWADGSDRPYHENGGVGFKFQTFKTKRYNNGFRLDNKTILQASFDVQALHIASHMQKMMTMMTKEIIDYLQDPTVWVDTDINIDHSDTATALGGGPWASATSTNLNIRKTLNAVENRIIRDTLGLIDQSTLCLVISPALANTIANTSEIQDYVKNYPAAFAQIVGKNYAGNNSLPNGERNRRMGLPDTLYGFKLIVEDAVIVTSQKGAAITRQYIKDDNSAIVLAMQDSLPGDQVGSFAVPNFSTFQVFYWAEEAETIDRVSGMNEVESKEGGLLTVEFFNDIRNRKVEGHVTTNWAKELVCPESGYLIDVTA